MYLIKILYFTRIRVVLYVTNMSLDPCVHWWKEVSRNECIALDWLTWKGTPTFTTPFSLYHDSLHMLLLILIQIDDLYLNLDIEVIEFKIF